MDPCNSKEQLRKITDLQSKPCWAPLNQLTMNLGKCWEILLLNAHLGGNYCKPAAALRSMAPVKRKSSLVKPLCALLSASHPRQTTPGCLGSHLPSIDRRPQTNASYCIYYVLLLYIYYISHLMSYVRVHCWFLSMELHATISWQRLVRQIRVEYHVYHVTSHLSSRDALLLLKPRGFFPPESFA